MAWEVCSMCHGNPMMMRDGQLQSCRYCAGMGGRWVADLKPHRPPGPIFDPPQEPPKKKSLTGLVILLIVIFVISQRDCDKDSQTNRELSPRTSGHAAQQE